MALQTAIVLVLLIRFSPALNSMSRNTWKVKLTTTKEFTPNCGIAGVAYDECKRECVCRNGKLEECHRVRKEFTSMKSDERILFITTLKKAASDSALKDEYLRLVNIHRDFFLSGLHEKAHFLPWHRWFLLEFENLLRKFNCQVTIPYWDWARVAQTYWQGSHIRDAWNPGPHGLGGNGARETLCVHDGPFKRGHWFVKFQAGVGCLRRQFNKEIYPKDSKFILKAINSSFHHFEQQMRDIFHTDIHCLIGGTMCTNASSSTPEFWLHHAFLDKLWADFQARGSALKYIYYPTLKGTLPGCDKHPSDVLDMENLPGGVRIVYDLPVPYDQPLE